MISSEKLTALLIVLIVIYLFYLRYEKSAKVPIEHVVEDYRPKVYLLTSAWNCEDCDQVTRRFMYTVGRDDGHIAITPSEDKEYELRQKYKLRDDENPVLIVERHGKPGEVTKGNLSITITLDDMVDVYK